MTTRGSALARRGGGGWSDLDPLLVEAVLLLRASNYVSGNWANEGTAGAALDGVVVTDDPSAPTVVTGPPRAVHTAQTDPDITNDENGFDVADSQISGDRTIAVLTTPDQVGVTSKKFLWKYDDTGGADLSNNDGWVIENVDNIGGGPGSGGLLVACNDGDAQPAGGVFEMIAGRQLLVARYGFAEGELVVDRNGAKVPNKFTAQTTSDISACTDAVAATTMKVGPGQEIEAVVIWDRVLTDPETDSLPDLLGL